MGHSDNDGIGAGQLVPGYQRYAVGVDGLVGLGLRVGDKTLNAIGFKHCAA